MKKVIRLTEADLVRIVKRVIVENEYNQEMEEGWLGDTFRGIKRFARGYGDEAEYMENKKRVEDQLDKITQEVMRNPEEFKKGENWDEWSEELLSQAEENNYLGNIRKRTSPNSDKYFVVYFPGSTDLEGIASAAGGSVRSGMSKTSMTESRRRYRRY